MSDNVPGEAARQDDVERTLISVWSKQVADKVKDLIRTVASSADLDLLAGLAAAGGSEGDVLTLNAQGKPVPLRSVTARSS